MSFQGKSAPKKEGQNRAYISVHLNSESNGDYISSQDMELLIDASKTMEIDSIFPEPLIDSMFLNTNPLGFGVRVVPEDGLDVSLQDENLLTFTGVTIDGVAEDKDDYFIKIRMIAIENEEIFLKIQVDSNANAKGNAKPKALIKGYPGFEEVSKEQIDNLKKNKHMSFEIKTTKGKKMLSLSAGSHTLLLKLMDDHKTVPVLDCTIKIPNPEFTHDEWEIHIDQTAKPSFDIYEEGKMKHRGIDNEGT